MVAESGDDPDAMAELESDLEQLVSTVDELEIQSLLSDKYDRLNCIFSLNAGAGGTDAQDWVQIMLRMYVRWFEKREYEYEIVDQSPGEEAGIKSVTIIVKGEFAYGYLKNEIGIHRLVRLSPFNANNKRQTSFAAVDVIPEIEQSIDLEIDPKDLRVDTFRATGAGGQHVNKTDSAVRITHLPTGITAQSQSSRSQISNRETALKMLTSRLVKRMEEAQKEKLNELRGTPKDIAWGHQVRSYVFHPYTLIKDHRTDYQETDLNKVLDGGLDPFIQSVLKIKLKSEAPS